jgi:DNA ligase (NAD+)
MPLKRVSLGNVKLQDIAVDALTPPQAGHELKRLVAAIAENDRRYYQQDRPVISDAICDAMCVRNSAIEAQFPDPVRADSSSHRIGVAPAGAFARVRHRIPVLSLDSAFDIRCSVQPRTVLSLRSASSKSGSRC